LGDVELPDRLNVVDIGANYLLSISTDDLGVEYVRSYALDRH
jgi:hypothetical protein